VSTADGFAALGLAAAGLGRGAAGAEAVALGAGAAGAGEGAIAGAAAGGSGLLLAVCSGARWQANDTDSAKLIPVKAILERVFMVAPNILIPAEVNLRNGTRIGGGTYDTCILRLPPEHVNES
jgi:hypothetical protein